MLAGSLRLVERSSAEIGDQIRESVRAARENADRVKRDLSPSFVMMGDRALTALKRKTGREGMSDREAMRSMFPDAKPYP